ncbi:MAG: hypothetical protein Faunusvirus2_15 [Faunusvirus sp.]|jgi:hypothetical protein|uniref:Uncharacterized protein n=1 Tax=Faunusvirus sp. TaxID=2487766 RepID=A0A3G4ZVZ0_9VIRU|nr:MAG: hypothetical protein Faunusvirus2_15 [Faunusvirus sp.]
MSETPRDFYKKKSHRDFIPLRWDETTIAELKDTYNKLYITGRDHVVEVEVKGKLAVKPVLKSEAGGITAEPGVYYSYCECTTCKYQLGTTNPPKMLRKWFRKHRDHAIWMVRH